jgi:hypothetical protein
VAVAWQVAFLILSRNPVRYRPMMVPSILEKAVFGIPAVILFMQQRISAFTLAAGLVDSLLGVLFVVAYLKTANVAE